MEVYNSNLRAFIRSEVRLVIGKLKLTFSFSWLLFGVIYYIISFVHTDFDYLHLDANGSDTSKSAFVSGLYAQAFNCFRLTFFQN